MEYARAAIRVTAVRSDGLVLLISNTICRPVSFHTDALNPQVAAERRLVTSADQSAGSWSCWIQTPSNAN